MKMSLFLVAGFFILAINTSYAQSPVAFKYKLNPSYSANNYKHQNKAELATKYNVNGIKFFPYIQPAAVLPVNRLDYKNHGMHTRIGMSGAVIPVPAVKKSQKLRDNPANYKHQSR